MLGVCHDAVFKRVLFLANQWALCPHLVNKSTNAKPRFDVFHRNKNCLSVSGTAGNDYVHF